MRSSERLRQQLILMLGKMRSYREILKLKPANNLSGRAKVKAADKKKEKCLKKKKRF